MMVDSRIVAHDLMSGQLSWSRTSEGRTWENLVSKRSGWDLLCAGFSYHK